MVNQAPPASGRRGTRPLDDDRSPKDPSTPGSEESAAGTEPAACALAIIRWALDKTRHFIRRYGLRLTQNGGRVGDLYIGVDEACRLLDDRGEYDLLSELRLPPPPVEEPLPLGTGLPLAALKERFDLEDLDLALLAAAAASTLSVDVARLYAFAWADFAIKLPPVSFLAELVTDSAEQALAALSRLRPDRPLIRSGLVRLVEPERWGGRVASVVHHGAVVPDPVVVFLRGETPLTGPGVSILPPTAAELPFPLPAEAVGQLERALDHGVDRLILRGQPGSGRTEALRRALGQRGHWLMDISARRLLADPDQLEKNLHERLLDARLRQFAVHLRFDGVSASDDDSSPSVAGRLIATHPGLVVLSVEPATRMHQDLMGDAISVDFPRAGPTVQRDLWCRELGDADLADQLVSRFDITPGALLSAVKTARRHAGCAGAPVDGDHVARALRARMRHALDDLAEPVQTTLTWDDVVLPDEVVDALREIHAHARHRAKVFDTWGFRRKMAYGRGLSCLFSGPPGTGKTMMAGIMANDLGRELYRVDLSRVVSKWVGETEKNLGRIFDEAEKAQVILFFDEADSLFSTRTEVKGANDRFANMEVNYLLQRMEQFDGVSILTTNFDRGLDEAFRRRLRFKVHFAVPDAEQRAELWRRMIPSETPVEGTIDFEKLGRKYSVSGGNIKNAVLRAGFYAAEHNGALTMARCRRAAEAELREMGRL